jgi:hypothetical protein
VELKAGICIGPGTPAGTVEPAPNCVALATGNGLTTMKSFFVSVLPFLPSVALRLTVYFTS